MLRFRHFFILSSAFIIAGGLLLYRINQLYPLFEKETTIPTSATTTIADFIPLSPHDPILGEKTAPITIVAFGDFGCEGCQLQDGYIQELMSAYPGKIKMIWKGLPATRFPYDSTEAHRYAYCAEEQDKFQEFQAYAFANGANLSPAILQTIAESIPLDQTGLTACLSSQEVTQYLEYTKAIATRFNIQAVPTLFVNNTQISAPKSVGEWKSILQLQ